ncbi:unnamed protein product [Prunus armeniaca]
MDVYNVSKLGGRDCAAAKTIGGRWWTAASSSDLQPPPSTIHGVTQPFKETFYPVADPPWGQTTPWQPWKWLGGSWFLLATMGDDPMEKKMQAAREKK